MIDMSKEWLRSSCSDLRNITYIIDDEYLTNIIAFHSQQSIEKSFKALIVFKKEKVPKQHDLLKLSGIIADMIKVDDDILDTLNELYIESRYPGDMGLLPNGKPGLEEAKEFYKSAKDIFNKVCDILGVALSDFKM